MTLNEFQEQAKSTAIYKKTIAKENHLTYAILGLVGEAGELAEKIKRVYRDSGGRISKETKNEALKELGDVLWYVSAIATELNCSLDEIAKINMEKLQSRRDRGKVQGSGDNR